MSEFHPCAAWLYTVSQTTLVNHTDRLAPPPPIHPCPWSPGVMTSDPSPWREVPLCLILFNELSQTALKCHSLNTPSWEGANGLISCFIMAPYVCVCVRAHLWMCVFEKKGLNRLLLFMSEYMWGNSFGIIWMFFIPTGTWHDLEVSSDFWRNVGLWPSLCWSTTNTLLSLQCTDNYHRQGGIDSKCSS